MKLKKIFTILALLLSTRFTLQTQSVQASSVDPVRVKLVSTNTYGSLLVTQNDEVFTWGSRFLVLGDGEPRTNNVSGFARISNLGDLANRPQNDPIIQASIGWFSFHLLTASGDIYSAGFNSASMVGNGTNTPVLYPIKINDFGALATLDEDDYVVKLAAAEMNLANIHALTKKGRVIGWGSNAQGGLGNNTNTASSIPIDITNMGDFSLLNENEVVIDIVNSNGKVIALTNEGRLFGWGYNFNGNTMPLSAPTLSTSVIQPRLLNMQAGEFSQLAVNDEKLIKLYPGYYQTAVETDKGNFYLFGMRFPSTVFPPTNILNFQSFPQLNPNERIVDYYGGNEDFIVKTSAGRLFAYGRNDGFLSGNTGVLATGDNLAVSVPLDITNAGFFNELESDDQIRFVTFFDTAYAVTEKGKFIMWGNNNLGQYLNDDSITSINVPFDATALYQSLIIDLLFTPAERVEAMIAALPGINDLSLNDETVLLEVRSFYDALSDDEKLLVTNSQALLDAEAKLALLSQQAIDQSAADEVIALINMLPDVNVLSLEDEAAVIAARTAYDALTPDQQALVTNYEALLDAEAKIGFLTLQANNQAAANVVIDLIDALPTVEALTLQDEAQVIAARTAYDALTLEQQALVTNYQTLLDVEAQLIILHDQFNDDDSSLLLWLLFIFFIVLTIGILFFLLGKKKSNQKVTAHPVKQAPIASPTQPEIIQKVKETKRVQTKQASSSKTKKPKVKPSEDQVTHIELGEVVFNRDLKLAPQFKELSLVSPGSYLEITPDFTSTNRVVYVQDTLPKVLEVSNRFVALTEAEVKAVKLSLTSGVGFIKLTPGTFIDNPGYYVEVDLKDELVDHFIFAKTRLAPTHAKGHRWIRIQTRKIKTKVS